MSVSTAELKAIISLQDQMSGQLKSVKAELAGLGAQVQHTNAAAASGAPSWFSMATAMTTGTIAGQALMGVMQQLGGQLMSMGKATSDFGQSMANIDAMTPAADMAQYGEAIEMLALRLGKDYPLSASEAGKAIEALVKKGTSLKDISGGAAEAVVKLSAATGGDLVVAAEVVNAALDTFKMTADDTSTATKYMTGAMLSSGMSLTDYKYGLSSAGAVVQSFGGSLLDLTIGLAAMTKAGIEGSDAGTSIKSMYNGLIPTTKSATSMMKELGIITKDGANQFVDANGKIKSYEEISKILYETTKDLTEVQRANTMELLFGTDGQRAATVAARNGAQEWGNLSEKVQQFDPGEVAQKRLASLSGSAKQFGGSVETAGIMLIKNLVPGMRTVIDTGTEMVNTFLVYLTTDPWKQFVANSQAAVADIGVTLYQGGQDISTYGEQFKNVGPAGKLFSDATTVIGDAAVGLAAILRGDAKGAAEAFLNALRDTKPIVDTLVVKPLDTAMGKAAEFAAFFLGIDLNPAASGMDKLAFAIARVGESAKNAQGGGMKDFLATLSNLSEIAGSSRVFFLPIIGMLEKLAEGFGGASNKGNDFSFSIAGIFKGLNGITTFVAAFLDGVGVVTTTVGKMIRVLAELALYQKDMWKGDADAARVHGDKIVEILKGTEKDYSDYWARTLKRSTDNGTALKNITDKTYLDIGELTREQLSGMLRTGAAYYDEQGNLTVKGMAEMNAQTQQGFATQIQRLTTASAEQVELAKKSQADQVTAVRSGQADQVAAVGAATPEFVAAVQSAGEQATTALDTGLDLGPIAQAGAAEATNAVAAEAPAASGAGMSIGMAIADGLTGGLASKVATVIQSARSLVNAIFVAGQEEADSHSPSKRAETDLGEPIGQGVEKGIQNLKGPVQAAVRDMIDAALAYGPIAAQVAKVEKEISSIKEAADTDALFRGKEMITIDSESLRLRKLMAEAERSLVPVKQAIARAEREIQEIERGTLEYRKQMIGLDTKHAANNIEINKLEAEKVPYQQRQLEIERELIGLDPENKKAKKLKEEQEELRKKQDLIDNSIAQIRLTTRLAELESDTVKQGQTIATEGARIRKTELEEQAHKQELAIQLIKDALDVLDAEKNVFQANEATIKNATENEIKYRQELIAVFKAEGKPLLDRIEAGLKLIDQLEAEGTISKELADKLREVAKQATSGASATKTMGDAAGAATPQMDAATKKANEMAEAAKLIGKNASQAGDDILGLGKSLGKLPDWFKATGSASNVLGLGKKHSGGPVQAGTPYLVGKHGAEELFVPPQDGTIISSEMTANMLRGDQSSYSGPVASNLGSGRHDRLDINFYVGDELAETIYVTGKDLATRRRTED